MSTLVGKPGTTMSSLPTCVAPLTSANENPATVPVSADRVVGMPVLLCGVKPRQKYDPSGLSTLVSPVKPLLYTKVPDAPPCKNGSRVETVPSPKGVAEVVKL